MMNSTASLAMDWIMVGFMATILVACIFFLGVAAYFVIKEMRALLK